LDHELEAAPGRRLRPAHPGTTVRVSSSRPTIRTVAPTSAPSWHSASHSSPWTRTWPRGRHSTTTSAVCPTSVSTPVSGRHRRASRRPQTISPTSPIAPSTSTTTLAGCGSTRARMMASVRTMWARGRSPRLAAVPELLERRRDVVAERERELRGRRDDPGGAHGRHRRDQRPDDLVPARVALERHVDQAHVRGRGGVDRDHRAELDEGMGLAIEARRLDVLLVVGERLDVRVVADRKPSQRVGVIVHSGTHDCRRSQAQAHRPLRVKPPTRAVYAVAVRPPAAAEAVGSTRPISAARSMAALRFETPSLRYTEIACVLIVLRETNRRSPISRNDRW